MASKTVIPDLPEQGRGIWRHPAQPGLELRGNVKMGTWTLRHRIDGRRVRDAIAKWPGVNAAKALDIARARLTAVSAKQALGGDELTDREARLQAKRARANMTTFEDELKDYAKIRLATLRSGIEAERTLRTIFADLLPARMDQIDLQRVIRITDAKRETAPAAADSALRQMKAFYTWQSQRGRSANILADLRVSQTRQRERYLTRAELGAVWNALDDSAPDRLIAMMICTAQRRQEVADMDWAEVDLEARLWTIPGSRMKNGRANVVPLNDLAIATLGERSHGLCFKGRNSRPVSGWSKLKAKLDRASGVSGWTLHDIRRTFASLVADTGANAIIVDRILGHTGSATLSQVAMIYQRSEFAEQKREVITTWANVIRNAAAIAKGANVIEIGCSA